MGFGAGFGAAFGPAFEAQRQREHEKDTDAFRYRMEDLIKRRDKYDEWKREDGKYADLAKKAVQITNSDPKAVGWAYDLLKSGADWGDVVKTMKSGKFTVNSSVDQQTKDAGLDSGDNPMGGGITPGAQFPVAPDINATQPTQPTQQSFDGGGFLSQIFPGMKKFAPQDRGSQVSQRVQETMGMTPDQIAEIDKGYQSPNMNPDAVTFTPDPTHASPDNLIKAQQDYSNAVADARANPNDATKQAAVQEAQRILEATTTGAMKSSRLDQSAQTGTGLGYTDVVLDPGTPNAHVGQAYIQVDGSYSSDPAGKQSIAARGITPNEQKQADDIAKAMGQPALELNTSASNVASAYNAFGIARKIIQDNPDVLQNTTANIDRFLIDMGKEFKAASDLVNTILADPDKAAQDPSTLKEAEAAEKAFADKIDDPSLMPAQKLAAARGLINAQYAIAAYHIAAAKGQSGKGLSETERKMFTSLADEATSPPQWDQLIGSILVPMKVDIEKQAQILSATFPQAKQFKDHYGYSPAEISANVDAYLEGTPGADLDRALPKENFHAVTPNGAEAPPAPNPAGPSVLPKFNSPTDVDAAKAAGTIKSGDHFYDANGDERTVP